MRSIVLALLVSAVCIAQDLPQPDQVVVEPDQLTADAHRTTGPLGIHNKASNESLELINFLDGQFDTDTGWSASTPVHAPWAAASLAVGSGELRAAVNWNVGFYQEGSNESWFQERLADFFGNGLLPPYFRIGSPQYTYDAAGGRFILVAGATLPSQRESWITIGTTYLPQGTVGRSDCTFRLDANVLPGTHTNFYADEPQIAMTAQYIVVTAEMRSFADGSFQYVKMWVIPKRSVYNVEYQNCPAYIDQYTYWWALKNADGTLVTSLAPANSSSSVTYLLNAQTPGTNGANALTKWQLDTSRPGAFTLTKMNVPTARYFAPPPAQQAGTSTLINTWDTRLSNVVYQGNSLWTAQTTGCRIIGDPTERSCLRWYQIAAQTGAVLQQSTFGVNNASVYTPWIVANGYGNAVAVFNASGPTAQVGIYFAGRKGTDAANWLPLFYVLQQGESCYARSPNNAVGGPRSGGFLDPNDANLFWISAAYTSGSSSNCSSNDWSTKIASVSFR
ncbi:MAG: hypothetical protein JOY54_19195 [Acidobacteriaceae bacterium]|nr:hypothetical protein [Acidobacteriaceae bacterium]